MDCDTHRDSCKTITDTPLFMHLEGAARDHITDAGRRMTLDAGFSLWQQGDAPEILAVIVAGKFKETVIDPQGGQKTLHLMRAGDLLGCAPAFGNFPRPATAMATETSELLYWPTERFLALMHVFPQLAINVLGITSRQTESLLRRLHEATSENADRRIARIVLRLAAIDEVGLKETPIELALSRQDLAELSDTTLFTVSRTVSAWNRMQIVKAGRGRLTVIDVGRLAGLAGAPNAS